METAETINSLLRSKFEKKCELMIKLLREEINGRKCEVYIMKLFACLIDNRSNETMILMLFPQGMPEQNKKAIFDDIGSKLNKQIKKYNSDNGTDYILYSLFLLSEVWTALYDHPVYSDPNDVSPSERPDRKEYLMIMGETIWRDKFLCQIELKRYKDRIMAGNEIERKLIWNDDKSPDKKEFGFPTLDMIFIGYSKAYQAASPLL